MTRREALVAALDATAKETLIARTILRSAHRSRIGVIDAEKRSAAALLKHDGALAKLKALDTSTQS